MAIQSNYHAPLKQEDSNNYLFPLINITLLFLVFGFITSMNDVLIPKLKSAFSLSYFQSMLIQFCFFFAYFVTAVVYYIFSSANKDPILRLGYKKAIVVGFLISALGSSLFYPASIYHSYPFFLLSLFILASGFAVLQISANPYVTLLGKPESASGRLNLTQAFNSVGATIAPLIGGKIILEASMRNIEGTNSIKLPYIVITVVLVMMALIIRASKLPKMTHKEDVADLSNAKNPIKTYRQLKYGALGIFMYVGGEVSIGSLIVSYISGSGLGISESQSSNFLSLYWGGAMIGRFFGAIFLSSANKKIKTGLMLVTLLAAFLFSAWIADFKLGVISCYWGLIVLNLIAFFLGSSIPQRTLSIFSISIVIALLIGVFAPPSIGMWAITSIGLFNSIMFPTIFSLGVRDLNQQTSKGASLLIMAVVGGAIIPLFQGSLADKTSIQLSYLAPLPCYLYLLFFGLNGYKKYQEIPK